MSVYALFPLIAIITYIPLLASTLSSRPWQKRHELFVLILVPAIMWSLSDYLLRSNFFPEYNLLLGKLVIIMFSAMAVQFHCFSSTFYAPGQSRWLVFSYVSLAIIIVLAVLGYVPEAIVAQGDRLYPVYGKGMLFLAPALLTMSGRDFYVFAKRLKTMDNPVLYSQIVSLMLGLGALILFALAALLPFGREYAVSHFGNILNASILSYAVIRHKLVDIRIVLRQGTAFATLGIIGAVSYWLLLLLFHSMFDFQLDPKATFVATAGAVLVAIFMYRLRGSLFEVMNRAFQGQTYDYRVKLSEFVDKIHNVFSLKEQGGELLALVTKAVDAKRACLFFPEPGSGDFTAHMAEPAGNDNPLSSIRLAENNPLLEYLERERKILTRENLAILTEFRGLWEKEKEAMDASEIAMFMPLISRDKLISVLVLGRKHSGRYSLEELGLLEDVSKRVAVSMEKEYLREQLRQREEELSVINRCSAIITSSLDIQEIYDSFIAELKKVLDISWAAIVLLEENSLFFLAISSEIGSAWKVGERVPVKGSATEWIIAHKQVLVEPDLMEEIRFPATGEYHRRQGVRSMVYLPLIAKGETIGSLIVASHQPNAYNQRHIMLLEQLAFQIAMPVENARLYAEAEEKARLDELTGLLNRRSLNEMIASEISRHSRYGGVFSIILLDLDSFKAFNDNYGHLAGDKLLKQIGGTLKGAIRDSDQAFRYGGDEFAILLPQTGVDAANQVSERARRQVALRVRAGPIPITASFGLASWPADGIGATEIIAAADAALYHAKRSGGNRIHCASGTLLPPADGMEDPERSSSSEGLSTVYTLAATVDARDHYTRNHSKRVSEFVIALAEALNLEPREISRLEICALLHDIGKIGVSDEMLNKAGKLTDKEWEAVKSHPVLGATIASRIHQLAPCVDGILHHHEKYDGSGYPKGLKGEEIPLDARILAIADAFAAMTSVRTYSDALSYDSALEELNQCAGTQFDPHLVEVFASVVRTTKLLQKEGS